MVVIRYHRVRRFVSIPEETTLKNEFNVLEEKKLAGQVEASSQSIVCGWRYVSLPTLSTTKASETARRTSVERGEEEVQEGSTSAQASKNFCMRLSYHRTLHVTSVIDRGFKPRRTLSFCVRYAGVDGKSMDVFDPPPIRRYRPL